MSRTYLTEEEKIQILKYYDKLGNKWTVIGYLMGKAESTIRNFIKRYSRSRQLSPKRGAPIKITAEMEDDIINIVEAFPEISLQTVSDITDISKSKCRKILNDNGIKYHRKIGRTPLTPVHHRKRVNFCQIYGNMPYPLPPIIFTDESTVCVNLNEGGIWRRAGEYPPGSFYDKFQKPKSVMVWGAIGPMGFRTPLIRVQGTLNAERYIRMLSSYNIPGLCSAAFPGGYYFQQDNAPAHSSRFTQRYLHQVFPSIIVWPPKSPDLSPIEQIWDYLKKKLAGRNFDTEDDLFEAIRTEWDRIPPEIIHNYYSSFKARCQACLSINGQSLNARWQLVKNHHDFYRTRLIRQIDQFGNTLLIEVP